MRTRTYLIACLPACLPSFLPAAAVVHMQSAAPLLASSVLSHKRRRCLVESS